MRMGEQCMDKVTQSEAINKKTKKKKKPATNRSTGGEKYLKFYQRSSIAD